MGTSNVSCNVYDRVYRLGEAWKDEVGGCGTAMRYQEYVEGESTEHGRGGHIYDALVPIGQEASAWRCIVTEGDAKRMWGG